LLTATCNEWQIENSKNHQKVILFNSTLTVGDVMVSDITFIHLFHLCSDVALCGPLGYSILKICAH